MTDLLKNKSQASPGTATLNVDKPEGGKLILRRVSLWTKEAFSYPRIYAWLFHRQHGESRKALFNKIIPQEMNGIATLLWDGSQDWPEGYRLSITTKTQVATEVLHYTISYEKGAIPMKRWGE